MMRKIYLPSNMLRISLSAILFLSIFLFGFKIHGDPEVRVVQDRVSDSNLYGNFPETDSRYTMPEYHNWRSFTTKDGLPSDKAFCVRVDGDKIWVGTDAGLAVRENEAWKTFSVEDGLAHRGVLSVDVSDLSGDVWIGTFSGLNRLSGGKFETFTQFNSGLPNDVIYQVVCDGKYIWVATGGGAGRFDTYTKQWSIFTEQNAPMHEPWTYGITSGGGKIFIAAWGGGVIEYDKESNSFRDYTDPDGEMELDLFPDDGLVHDITTGVSYAEDVLWVGTYFGLSRYDGTHWKGYFDHDSGLPSNFINFIKANGSVVWVCTDNGLSSFDGSKWITYRPASNGIGGDIETTVGASVGTMKTSSSIAHNFVLGVDFQEEDIWVATSKGVSNGRLN
jgi:ligand-binding sensor domain-containing protein